MADQLSDRGRSVQARPPEEPQRILVVEDDQDDAEVISGRLTEAWPQVQISTAATVQDAVAALTSAIECVVLDLQRHGGEEAGLVAVRQIRADAPELPIVVMVENDEYGSAAISAGAQDFLLKRRIDGLNMARAIRHSIQRARAERFWRELALLRFQSAENARVQRGLIPNLLINDDRISTRSGYRPGNRRQVLGGDFFDVIQSSPTHLHMVLGDVCGHGPDEAALGVQLRIAWRTLVLAGVNHHEQLVTLDRLTAQERHADHVYATVASLEVDLGTGEGYVALAGHPPPILVTEDNVRLVTDVPGPPLGLDLPPRWGLHEIKLGQAWTLLLYSDGIYEGHVVSRGTRLGIDGLLELISAGGPEAVWPSVPDLLLDQVEALNDGPLEDDVALLAVRFGGYS